jgi:hypothetical protein
MKYPEAINGPDREFWKAEGKKEHQRMVDSGVFKKVKRSELPSEVKIMATKKKSSRTFSGRVNV